MNKQNDAQIWKIWNSGYDEEEIGTCDEHSSPVGFQMIIRPKNQDSTSKAFYGMTYQGRLLYSLGNFFDAVFRL